MISEADFKFFKSKELIFSILDIDLWKLESFWENIIKRILLKFKEDFSFNKVNNFLLWWVFNNSLLAITKKLLFPKYKALFIILWISSKLVSLLQINKLLLEGNFPVIAMI